MKLTYIIAIIPLMLVSILSGCKKESHEMINAMLLETTSTADLGDLKNVKKYVEKGADIEIIDENTDLTPLLSAVCGKGERFQKYANDPDSQWIVDSIRENESIFIVKYLIGKGANLKALDSEGSTALHLAVYVGRPRMAAALIDLGFDINAENAVGATPLIVAASSGSLATVKLLVEKGANIKHVTKENATALDIALQYEQKVVADYLEGIGVARSFGE